MPMSEGQSFVGSPRGWRSARVILALVAPIVLAACSDPLSEAYQESQIAEAMLAQGNLPAARAAIRRALALREDQVDFLLLDARIKFLMEDMMGAYDGYSVVLAIDPNNPEALLGVSQLGMSVGRQRESREATERILMMDPGQPDALLVKGVHALNRNRYEEALALGERLLESVPGDPRGVVLKARATFLLGRPAEALAMLQATAIELGNNPMIATALLENARDQGDVPVMLEQLSLLRQIRPDSIDLAIDEANVRYKSGDTPGARAVGAEILANHGDDAAALARLGDLWTEYDRDPLSSGERAALGADGRHGARLAAARHYFKQGDLAAADTLLGRLADDRAAALRARIALAAGRGGSDAAEAIRRRDTTNCDALATLAEAALADRRPEPAIVAAQVVASECRDRTDGFLLLARAYGVGRRSAGIERSYREGVAVHPSDRELSARFAGWLLDQGRGEAAVSAARRLTQRAPAKVSSWRLLAAVCERAEDAVCVATARDRERAARGNYAIDIRPGQRPVNPLLGQSWR